MKKQKNYLLLAFIVLIYCMPYTIFGQRNDLSIPHGVDELKISIRQIEGTVYINWKEYDQSINSTYIIQKSDDGEEYDIIGTKNSIALKKSLKLAYYFEDTLVNEPGSFYKVIRIDNASSELVACSNKKYIIQPGSDNTNNQNGDCCIFNTAFNEQ